MSRNRLKPAIEKITSQAISPRAAAELSLALLIDDDSHRIYRPTQESQFVVVVVLVTFAVRRVAGWLNPHTWYTIHIITITSSRALLRMLRLPTRLAWGNPKSSQSVRLNVFIEFVSWMASATPLPVRVVIYCQPYGRVPA